MDIVWLVGDLDSIYADKLNMKILLVLFVVGVICSQVALADLTSEQVAAKNRGLFLYNLRRTNDAASFLKVAAEAGDRESQYFLGEVIRKRATYVSPESQYWYQLAANQNDVYAMMRLFKVDDAVCVALDECTLGNNFKGWRVTARKVAESRAAEGSGEAMYQLFLMSGEYDWLVKSAEAGFGEGQYWLSVEYRQGWGIFFVPGKRTKAADKWLYAAAYSGYGPAMDKLRSILADRGDIHGNVYWTEQAAKAGSLSAIVNYAAWMANTSDYFKYPLDLVKAYGLTLVIAEAELPSRRRTGRVQLKKLSDDMTPDQIRAGVVFAEIWKKNYSPLSRFPTKHEVW